MNILGIDIGGTKIAICLGNERGDIIQSKRFPTIAASATETFNQAVKTTRELLAENKLKIEQIDAIGISSPGPMSAKKQMMYVTPNLKAWGDVEVGRIFREAFNRPVFMNNDANGAGLAEWMFGESAGAESLIYLTCSTGIGGGIVDHGKLIQGVNDLGGEIGHVVVDINGPPCGCGRKGCIESYCGGKNCADRARERIINEQIQTAIFDEADGDLSRISMKEICAAVRKNDAFAIEVWDEYCERITQCIGMLLMTFNPDAFILGTIAIHDGDIMLPRIEKALPKYAWEQSISDVKIRPSSLKQIGELGAIAIAIAGLND